MPRPREAAPDAGTRGLWAEYMVWRGGDRPGLAPPHRPPPLRPPPAPRPPPLGPGGSWRPSPHAPPAAPLRLPHTGGLCRARLRTAPPASRRPGGGGGQRAPAPPRPPARAGAVTGRAARGPSAPPPPSPSSRAEPGGRGRWGGARRACAGAAPSLPRSLARSLPPSLVAPVGNGSGPARPGCRCRRPAFLGPGPAAQRWVDRRPRADRRTSVRASVRSERAPRRTTAASPPRHYYALPSPRRASPALSPLPPRPSAQARPPAREPIGCSRRARVSPRRAHPHWPPRGNVSHMQIRAGRGRLRLAPSRPGRDRERREAGRAHCSKGAEPGGRRLRAPRCGGPGAVCGAVCPVRANNTLTRGSAHVGAQGPLGQTNCA